MKVELTQEEIGLIFSALHLYLEEISEERKKLKLGLGWVMGIPLEEYDVRIQEAEELEERFRNLL